jgi:hypothetical protein
MVKLKTTWYAAVLFFLSLGVVFLGIGTYILITSWGNLKILIVGGACAFAGLRFLWEAGIWIKPAKPKQEIPSICPHCGALIRNGSDFCEKCGKASSG